MKTPRFEGRFKWSALRDQLQSLREDVQTVKKVAGRNVTVSEHPGKGTVINVERLAAAAVGTGACCIDGECSILTAAQCAEAGGTYLGDDTGCDPNPCVCISHITIEACFQYGGEDCYVNILETIEADVDMECPLDLETSGCKMISNDFPLSSQTWVGCSDPEDISGAFFHFYPVCLFFDATIGWSFTPSIVFPNWPLTVLSSGVVLGFVDLIADGPFESDPSDGPCPCWVEDGGSIQCNHYTITFS